MNSHTSRFLTTCAPLILILALIVTAAPVYAQKTSLEIRLTEDVQKQFDSRRPVSYEDFRKAFGVVYQGAKSVHVTLLTSLIHGNEVIDVHRSTAFTVCRGEVLAAGDQFLPDSRFFQKRLGQSAFASIGAAVGSLGASNPSTLTRKDPFVISGIPDENHMLQAVQQAREAANREDADALFLTALPEDRRAVRTIGTAPRPWVVLFSER